MFDCISKKVRWSFVFFLLFFPVFLTWIYFSLAVHNPLFQKTAYSILKTIQFLLPVCWTFFILKRSWKIRPYVRRGILEGCCFGLLVFGGIVLFYLSLRNTEVFASSFTQLTETLSDRFSRLNMKSPLLFILLGLFYSIIHSGLEEYYWRWFAYGELSLLLKNFWRKQDENSGVNTKDEVQGDLKESFPLLAALISSLAFTFHHIIILTAFFGLFSFICWFCVLGVFVGGLYWCWLYYRADSIWGAWLSHCLIDAALFAVGYIVLFC